MRGGRICRPLGISSQPLSLSLSLHWLFPTHWLLIPRLLPCFLLRPLFSPPHVPTPSSPALAGLPSRKNKIGYRAINTAQAHSNEAACGRAIGRFLAKSGEPRSSIFFTTMLRTNTSYAATRASIAASLAQSATGHIDLFLLHSPFGGTDKRRECWRAVEDAVLAGEVRSAGVSNFGVHHLQELLAMPKLRVRPAVNQLELHPFHTNDAVVDLCRRERIAVAAYAPLVRGLRMDHPTIVELARRHAASPAQVLLRWGLQRGFVVVPKTVREDRLRENADLAGLVLSDDDMDQLNALNEGLVTAEFSTSGTACSRRWVNASGSP